MRILERIFCGYMWLLWVGLRVGRRSGRPEELPTMTGSSGEACRRLVPDRTILPGW